MEHHLIKESVRVLEKLEREVSEQLARAHSDSLKSKLEELREHLRGSAHNKLDSETRNPDLTFFAKVRIRLYCPFLI